MNQTETVGHVGLTACRLCGAETIHRSGVCLYCQREMAGPERTAALKLPGAETMLNGICVGRVVRDEKAGTCAEIVWCGCGKHVIRKA